MCTYLHYLRRKLKQIIENFLMLLRNLNRNHQQEDQKCLDKISYRNQFYSGKKFQSTLQRKFKIYCRRKLYYIHRPNAFEWFHRNLLNIYVVRTISILSKLGKCFMLYFGFNLFTRFQERVFTLYSFRRSLLLSIETVIVLSSEFRQ